ncbi:MAG: S8 family serine peptidase [Opitutales bacterium]|nr:S8 family serine peptidase [Opitutales bacterium]
MSAASFLEKSAAFLFCAIGVSSVLNAEIFYAQNIAAQNFVLSYNEPENTAEIANLIVGADAFFSLGVYGQGAKAANVELGVYLPGHYALADTPKGEVVVPEGAEASALYSPHATGTAGVIAGYNAEASSDIAYFASLGIAPLAELSAGSVARSAGNGNVSVGLSDFYGVYSHFFGASDVINSSWGTDSADAGHVFAFVADSLACQNTNTTFVVSAGNSGGAENTVHSLALSYNGITVGALGNPSAFDRVADFSSRSPSDFYNPISGEIASSVRPAVDICAPGENISFATFEEGSDATDLFLWSSGTSIAAPIASGVVCLMNSASRALEEAYGGAYGDLFEKMRDTRVVKAILLNSAKKPAGWTNNQIISDYTATLDLGGGITMTSTFPGVILTTQGLDFDSGAGSLDAAGALEHIMNLTQRKFWTLSEIPANSSLWYDLGWAFEGELLSATLVWNAHSEVSEISGEMASFDSLYFSNLGLELWIVLDGAHNLVAVSDTSYNNVEHLYLELATDGEYLLRVAFFDMAYGEMPETETFALAYALVPEASFCAAIFGAAAFAFALLRRRASRKQIDC